MGACVPLLKSPFIYLSLVQRQWLKVFRLSIVGTATNRSDNRQRPITVTCDHNFQSLKFLEISRCNFYLLQQRSFCSCKIKLKIWFCWFFMSLNFLLSFLHIWRSSKWKTKKTKKSWKKKIVSSSIIKWLLFFFFVVDLIYNSCVADMGGIPLGTLFDNVFINAFTLKDMGSSPRYYDIDRLTNVTVVLKHFISFFDFILVDFENLSCSAS